MPLSSPFLSQGGFRKLISGGAFFPDCQHLACTFSSTTVATIATGAWPAQHGIVAETWYDRATKRRVTGTEEEARATTLAAEVAGASDKNRVYVISESARHARLFASPPSAKVFWMDEAGQFATLSETPGWLAGFNSNNSPDNLRGQKWMAVGAKSDTPPLRVLNYSADRPAEFANLLKASPFAQTAQFDLLGECIERDRLGTGDGIDLVCLIVSAGERLGYEVGGRDPLMTQMALRLDQNLEMLFARLGRAVGDGGYTLAVASGHGAPPRPTEANRSRLEVDGESIADLVDKALKTAGIGSVQRYLYPFLYLDTSAVDDPETVRRVAADTARTHPAVADTFTAGGQCSAFNSWRRRFENSFHAQRSGDVMISYRPEYVEKFGPGHGVSYGSVYDYETQTPLFLYGPQFRPGNYEMQVETVDIAPTLARAIGIGEPSSSCGKVLDEALTE